MKIYLDLTFMLNLVLCYIIFMLHDLVYSYKTPWTKKILASLIGSFVSVLMIIYPRIFSNPAIKIIFFITISLTAFGFQSLQYFIKKTISLFAISFIAAGTLFWLTMDQDGVVTFINPVLQISELSKILFFLLGLVIFIPLTRVFILNIKSLFNNKNYIYNIEIMVKERKVALKGFMDTGNSLYDPISKLPVIIANKDKLKDLLGKEWDKFLQKGELWNIPTDTNIKVSFIPFKSMGGEEMLVAFKADKVTVISGIDAKKDTNCLIGLNINSTRMHPGVDALIHPSIVS